MAIVDLSNVTKDFGSTRAVDDFCVSVEPGEFLSFLGPSGCGKTTSLRLVAGFVEPTHGRVSINGRVVSDPASGVFVQPEERNLGMVFQSYAVWPHMTVFDNVAYPLRIKRESRTAVREKVGRTLALVKMEDLADRFPHQLSGGQQQRVALARALVTRPDVLLLDEPLSNLDAKLRDEMRIEIKELQRRTGVTIIFVTHDQLEAMVMSDRVVVMDRGRVRQIGPPEEIYRRPADRFVADFVGAANFLEVESGAAGMRLPESFDGGTMPLALSPPAARSSLLMVRPEDLALSGTEGHLRGEVETRMFLGDALLYVVRIGKAKRLRAKCAVSTDFQPGSEVFVTITRPYFLGGAGNDEES